MKKVLDCDNDQDVHQAQNNTDEDQLPVQSTYTDMKFSNLLPIIHTNVQSKLILIQYFKSHQKVFIKLMLNPIWLQK